MLVKAVAVKTDNSTALEMVAKEKAGFVDR